MKEKNKGFTFIELMVAITIIGVLMGFTLTALHGSRKSARDGRRKADLEQIRSALEMYRVDTGSYPITLSFGEPLTHGEKTYMEIPKDPIDSVSSSYQYTYDSDGSTYTLCAKLETTGKQYCVKNP